MIYQQRVVVAICTAWDRAVDFVVTVVEFVSSGAINAGGGGRQASRRGVPVSRAFVALEEMKVFVDSDHAMSEK